MVQHTFEYDQVFQSQGTLQINPFAWYLQERETCQRKNSSERKWSFPQFYVQRKVAFRIKGFCFTWSLRTLFNDFTSSTPTITYWYLVFPFSSYIGNTTMLESGECYMQTACRSVHVYQARMWEKRFLSPWIRSQVWGQ